MENENINTVEENPQQESSPKKSGGKIKNLLSPIINLVVDFFKGWNKPLGDKCVPSKEIVAYSIGGMGVQFIAAIANLVTMSASTILIGTVYGVKPTHIFMILAISTVFTVIMQPLKSWLIDNTRTKAGKVRPYLLWLSFPSAILLTAMAYIPRGNYNTMLILMTILFTISNFVYQFYLGQYTLLPQLMTSNSTERAAIYSVSSIVYSMAPTITGALFPLIAGMKKGDGTSYFYADGWGDPSFYKLLFPILAVAGCLISLLAYFGTKERLIVPKAFVAKVGFKEGFAKIIKNKYFWIINGSNIFTFARAAITSIMTWAYVYMLQNNNIYSVMTLLMGTASLVGMILGPIMCSKLGKRNTTLLTDLLFVVASVVLVIYNSNFYIIAAMLYICFWAVAVQLITAPAMNGDALDYLQWKTGERLEGFVQNFTIITSLLALATQFVIPAVQESFGLFDNYAILYDVKITAPMFRALALISIVGAVAHAAPYLFWDLNNKKHEQIIADLKRRAIEEDIKNGQADEEELGELATLNEAVGDVGGNIDEI